MRLENLLKGVIFASAFYASLTHSAFETSFLVSSEIGWQQRNSPSLYGTFQRQYPQYFL